jgi:putative DNA methylase
MKIKKKLIEVALPLDAISKASAREKSIRHGHPSTLHLWWARRPLATARAVIFAQMVDDPSGHPDLFPTEKAQEKERKRLFKIIEDLVLWENTTNEEVLQRARDEIWQSWRRTCAENADHPQAKELFDRHNLPAFHDPFAGGGALPLEAQRLGLESHASDLNPVAVLINKAMIEIPPKFAGKPPVNPEAHKEKKLIEREWKGAQGLAEDVRYYGNWMREEAEKRIGHLYPKVEITSEIVKERPDLQKYEGRQLTVIAWLWARTVKSPNPAFADVDVPLVSTFMLATKKGKEAYVDPVIEGKNYRFAVKAGVPKDAAAAKRGTKSGSSGSIFLCLMSDTAMPFEYLRSEAKAGRMKEKLMSVVAEGDRGRVYLAPTVEMESIALNAQPQDAPETDLPKKALGFRIQEYGMLQWRDLFTPRQLVGLTTFSDLVQEAQEKVISDAKEAGYKNDASGLDGGGSGSTAYGDAVAVYLAFAVDRMVMTGNSLVRWNAVGQKAQHCFGRQALPMLWDFAEPNFLGNATGNFSAAVFYSFDPLNSMKQNTLGMSRQEDAASQLISSNKIISTDPPYYDNIGYADLSDFFYVWLRRSLRMTFPNLFSTLTVPKAEELVATPFRHGNKENAESFFLDGMTRAMHRLAEQAHPFAPVTIYYAFKQSESKGNSETSSTGWETFLAAVISAGFSLTGTWPVRTEMKTRQIAMETNALASSIVLVCRPRLSNTKTATRGEFIATLRSELPKALIHLQRGNIAPVDLAQASIGPGMAIFTRYSRVLDAEGEPLSVRQALGLINQTLDDVLAEQEGDFDEDSRWALAWFEQIGFAEGEFGVADDLSRAKNTSVAGLIEAGIIESGRGKVRLWKPNELPGDWDPDTDRRLTNWEMVHHLIRLLEANGESAAAKIMIKLGGKAEVARELCYRLYNLCERKKRAIEALSYNGLVQSWPEITRLAREGGRKQDEQTDLFDDEE